MIRNMDPDKLLTAKDSVTLTQDQRYWVLAFRLWMPLSFVVLSFILVGLLWVGDTWWRPYVYTAMPLTIFLAVGSVLLSLGLAAYWTKTKPKGPTPYS